MKDLDTLIHDVNSRCSSLKEAAGLLRAASAAERAELLALMKEQAKKLAEGLAAFPG